MAAAARLGPADARIPCPLCGGLIHPIAGRCKHCKADLSVMRSSRPAAAAALPALHGASPVAAPVAPAPAPAAPNPYANGHANGHHAAPAAPPPPQNLVQTIAAAGPIPLAIHSAHAQDISQPILPPRPTGRFIATAPRASWKSWPVIVIILAAIAIVTAVILMLWPPGGAKKDGGINNSLQPAPDRMDTNPTPSTPRAPNASPDPWSRGGPTAPTRPPTPVPDVPDIDDPDLTDPLAGAGGRSPFSPTGRDMTFVIIKHACDRIVACGSSQNVQLKQLCDQYSSLPIRAPSCVAATRCLRAVDELSCDIQLDDPLKLMRLKDQFSDCADAMRC